MPGKGRRRDQADLGGKDHEHRQFEHQAETQKKQYHEIDESADGNHRLQILGLKTEQKLDAEGQGDQIAEDGATIKQAAGCGDKPSQPAAGHLKRLAHRLPQHVHAQRHQDIERAEKGQLDMGEKGAGHGEKIEMLAEMVLKNREQPTGKKKEEHGGAQYGNPKHLQGITEFDDKDSKGFQ